MQENKHLVGGVLVPYQTDVKLGCAHSCMAAHIHLTVARSLFKNCIDDHAYRARMSIQQ